MEAEIKSWLTTALKTEISGDFSVKIVGNSGKGDGFIGDVIFVQVSSPEKDYNLVLKCAKQNEGLQSNPRMKLIFINEIFVYKTVLPAFIKFQKSHNLKNIFDSVPKCFGSYKSDVVVLEDMKKIGYELWPKTKPLNRKHVEFVVREYGKLHAVSVALEIQQEETFRGLVEELERNVKSVWYSEVMKSLLVKSLERSGELLKNKVPENDIQKFLNLKKQIGVINSELEDDNRLKVICHGDCWNNNFMYKYENNNKTVPLQVAFLDWQIARYASPISDLSYFLFSCISEEDIEDLETVLVEYYNSFSNHLKQFGLDSQNFYSFEQFINDWKTCSKHGLVMANLVTKASYIEKDEVIDIGDAADKGKTLADSFLGEIKNTEGYGRRVAYLVKYAAKHNLI